jgi:nucleolysin TIA-1/TIAR
MNSGKSRGYGFLAFRDKTDAEQAIATMNGEWLGSRAIRVNWANQKTQGAPAVGGAPPPRPGNMGGAPGGGGAPAPINFQGGPLSYETVVTQTAPYNSTVYVGNLVPYCTQADLIPLFQSIGYLSEIRMQADRGFAFVKLDTHEHAAMAIVQLQGQMVHGRPIKCSWGKDRVDGAAVQPAGGMSPTAPAAPYGGVPMYGIPQPNTYGQYGFPGFAGFPGQAAGAPGATPAAQGMPQANAAASGLGLPAGTQPAGSDPNAAAAAGQAAQAQWGADPSYYSNYWGGYYGQQAAGQPGGDAQMQGPA